jgi:hypothetical protein
MSQLPTPIRAALGLVASVVQDRQGLSDKALELPVLAVSTVLQLSLRAQQQYAALTVRGDELLAQLHGGPPDDPPDWARFDDESVLDAEPQSSEPQSSEPQSSEPRSSEPRSDARQPNGTARPRKANPPRPAAQAKPAKAAPAKAAAPRADLDKPADKRNRATAAKKTSAAKRDAKTISAPRNGRASAFDRAADPDPDPDPTAAPDQTGGNLSD